jgi:hypothetical protein
MTNVEFWAEAIVTTIVVAIGFVVVTSSLYVIGAILRH